MKQASDPKLTPKSLSCLNHLKHGSTSKTLFLKDENPEEFFALLGVGYDPKVLSVVRLHILRRMGQYLVNESFEGLDEAGIVDRCREFLGQAYADFVTSSPLDQRVFKVLREAVAKPKSTVFVPLTALK